MLVLAATFLQVRTNSSSISYSGKDEEFARRLYERMLGEKLRVWFAPDDLRRGEKPHEQIDRAIQVNDRLLVVLSKHSMQSDWVKLETATAYSARRLTACAARKASKAERDGPRPGAPGFPITLVPCRERRRTEFIPFEEANGMNSVLRRCLDPHTGEDLADEIRQYFLPDDFSNWKDHDSFKRAFVALLRDLRAQA